MHKCSFFRGYRRGQGAFPGEGMETAKNACQFPLPPSLPAAVSKVQRNPPIYWVKSGAKREILRISSNPRDSFLFFVQFVYCNPLSE